MKVRLAQAPHSTKKLVQTPPILLIRLTQAFEQSNTESWCQNCHHHWYQYRRWKITKYERRKSGVRAPGVNDNSAADGKMFSVATIGN